MSNVQAICGTKNGENVSFDFTTELRTHENASANGADPTAGNDIVVGIRAMFGGNVTGVTGSDSTAWTADHEDDTNQAYFYRISDIASGVTSFTVACTAAGTEVFVWVWEDDETLAPGNVTAWSDSGEGSSSLTHDWSYTTDNSTDTVVGFCHPGGNRQYSAPPGS